MKNQPSQSARAKIDSYLPSKLIELFCHGIEEFNQAQFYECHETLEAVWQKQIGKEREMTQGIIQIAVALYHLERKNEAGALKLLERGLARIERFDDHDVGLNISVLAQSVRILLSQLRDKSMDREQRTASLKISFL